MRGARSLGGDCAEIQIFASGRRRRTDGRSHRLHPSVGQPARRAAGRWAGFREPSAKDRSREAAFCACLGGGERGGGGGPIGRKFARQAAPSIRDPFVRSCSPPSAGRSVGPI